MKEKIFVALKIALSMVLIGLFASIFVGYIYKTNNYPLGSDIYGHLFKAEYLFEEIAKGNILPKYSPHWYNGVELFRYWPPGSYYLLALINQVTLNIYDSYLVFLVICIVLSSLGFLFFGIQENKIVLSSFLSILYFVNPDNLRVLFDEGNVPRILINSLLPLVFFFVYEILKYKKVGYLGPLGFVIMGITYTHFMISAMISVSIFLYGLIFAITHKESKPFILVISDLIFSYLTMGFVLLSGLSGGLVSNQSASSEGVAALWSQEIYKSLNPFLRYENLSLYYFGLSIFIILLIGIFITNIETLPNFVTALLIFLSTTITASKLIRMLPLNQLFWMQRFIPMSLLLFFFGLILWKKLRKSVLLIFLVLIIVDTLPSFRLISENKTNTPVENAIVESNRLLLDRAVEVADNKIAVMDLSKWGSFPSYYLTNNPYNKKVIGLFGWAIQGASDEENIVNLNESFEKKFYLYMFDRLFTYGADTVLFKKSEIKDFDKLLVDAEKLNYSVVDENTEAILFKRNDLNYTYGTKSDVKKIAIGKSSEYICYIYPSFERGFSDNLDDYSIDELSKYDKIYLSDFDYSSEEEVSKKLSELSNLGIKIYVDMNKIKIDRTQGKGTFMGVTAEEISFSDTFPVLTDFNNKQFKLAPFTENYTEWKTYYLRGASKILFSTSYKNLNFTYVGSDELENIYYIGLNLIYYYYETGDSNLGQFLNDLFSESQEDFIEREIVPLDISYSKDYISITSPADNVNTNIAALSCFLDVTDNNNFIFVNSGEHIYTVKDSLLKFGALISAFGFAFYFTLCFSVIVLKKEIFYEKEG